MTKKVVVPESKTEAADYLMWVGSVYYPTVDTFIAEAEDRGPCKRMGRIPRQLVNGKSRIFLAHDDGLVGEGFVFGYFIPNRVEYLCHDLDAPLPAHLEGRVTPVALMSIRTEEDRECGERNEGLYVMGFSQAETEGELVFFDKPRRLDAFDAERGHFRGLLQIEYGDAVVKARGKKLMVPPSRTATEPIDPNTPWTEEEDEMVLSRMEGSSNRARVAQLISFETGRPKSSVNYRFLKLSGRLNGKAE